MGIFSDFAHQAQKAIGSAGHSAQKALGGAGEAMGKWAHEFQKTGPLREAAHGFQKTGPVREAAHKFQKTGPLREAAHKFQEWFKGIGQKAWMIFALIVGLIIFFIFMKFSPGATVQPAPTLAVGGA